MSGLLLILAVTSAVAASPQLEATPARSSDGVIQLQWELQGQPVELQRADNPAFAGATTLYRGTDSASLRSGLADGHYFYRLRITSSDSAPGPWSESVMAEVVHHPARRAWGMFALGALVFVATLGLILIGGRREVAHG